jgi:hypothetical protein
MKSQKCQITLNKTWARDTEYNWNGEVKSTSGQIILGSKFTDKDLYIQNSILDSTL